jgi:membrane-bound lytic murein transglycosylase D
MSVETLKAINGIGPRAQVPAGHTLLVPAQTPTVDGAASLRSAVFTTVPSGRTFYYTVRRGDTLARVAARFNVTTADLRRWNSVPQELRVGQQLRITSDAAPVRTARHGNRHGSTQASAKGQRTGANARAKAGGTSTTRTKGSAAAVARSNGNHGG